MLKHRRCGCGCPSFIIYASKLNELAYECVKCGAIQYVKPGNITFVKMLKKQQNDVHIWLKWWVLFRQISHLYS